MTDFRTATFSVNEMLTKKRHTGGNNFVQGKIFHERYCIFVVCLIFYSFNKK